VTAARLAGKTEPASALSREPRRAGFRPVLRRAYAGAVVFCHCCDRNSKEEQRRSKDQIALEVEEIVDGGMYGEKALRRHRRLEALHLALSSSDHLV